MQQFQKILRAIPVRQRWMIGTVALAIVAGLYFFSIWQHDRNFKPLYTGLAAEDAGAVVQKLRESSTEYRIIDNGATVQVPASRLAELRLEMASAGIPKTGRIGFELFDKTNFGMTEFTEHVNYRRALEGELERTVTSVAAVEQARVHLTFPKDSVFTESKQNAKASVLLKLRMGAKLENNSVTGITNLVASAVEGLSPENVSVMDMHGNLLSRQRSRLAADGSPDSEAAMEYRQKIEKDIVAKVNATLDPLLGGDRFRAAASVECDMTSGEQSEETFDPSKSVMTSSQRSEQSQTSVMAGGLPGVASNLPRPPSKNGSESGVNNRTEQINYQSSRSVKHTKLPQGTVKKVSVAVLLDQTARWEGSGPKARKVLVPVPAERIKTIHDVLAAAIGISTERGDQLIVESLPFESTLNSEQPEVAAPVAPSPQTLMDQLKSPRVIGTLAAAVLVVLGLLGFIVTRMRKSRSRVAIISEPTGHELPPATEAVAVESGEDLAELASSLDKLQHPAIAASRLEVLTGKLRTGAVQDANLYAGVLRNWLAEEVSK